MEKKWKILLVNQEKIIGKNAKHFCLLTLLIYIVVVVVIIVIITLCPICSSGAKGSFMWEFPFYPHNYFMK